MIDIVALFFCLIIGIPLSRWASRWMRRRRNSPLKSGPPAGEVGNPTEVGLDIMVSSLQSVGYRVLLPGELAGPAEPA